MIFKRNLLILLGLLLLLCLAAIPAIVAGEYHITAQRSLELIWAKLTGAPTESFAKVEEVIVWKLRLPRMLLALTAGMALAIAGTTYQGCFRNPLVEPYILGVSSGAACGAALAIIFPLVFPQMQLTAFFFALSAVAITYFLAQHRGETSTVALVLAGIIVGALFSSMVGIMKYLAEDAQLREITFWMMGGLHYANWEAAQLNAAYVLPCFVILWFFSWKLNLLSLSDQESRSLGINPSVTRLICVCVATLAAAICVSLTGIIAWVGLMMPHAARLLLGSDHRWVIPGAAIMGGIYLLICDTLARTLTSAEIPLGIVTSIVGAPYLLWLLRSKGRQLYGM